MSLSAWRDAVAFGAYFQPIHLQVDHSNDASTASVRKQLPCPSSQKSRQVDSEMRKVHSNEISTTQQSVEAPPNEMTSPTSNETTATVIPPFGSQCFNNGEQIALNVGGPVWAMDWLPSKPAENAAAVAANYSKMSQKKTRTASATRKDCKESPNTVTLDDLDGETTEASNGSVEIDHDSQLEWKFLALSTHPPCQVEDMKVVKATPPDHYYDVAEGARNLIQIWAIPVQRRVKSRTRQSKIHKTTNNELVQPRIVYAIDHDSGVAWDMQWCPLLTTFLNENQRKDILGVLAVCFGDGSMRVFEVPTISDERLQPTVANEADCVVEKNIPIVVAQLPRTIQLSVQWSPHNWNLLLTGGSDGSVSLWNIKTFLGESDTFETKAMDPGILEPQRRFQDADTIGKQEAFDWGCGWVAIRAVAWSPFDEHIFATTGNDSVFKVWDIREPRVCLRSHRIRSTWGLALQWMDQTSIQISGDQGSVYMYDILSGSYQKLHYHPQIDSPVWDLQFARRGALPLLVSSCTSGSIRAAPAKKLYRSPQNCVEICRLSGEKDSSIEKPFKALTISFKKHSVKGSADPVKQNTREFCERDAALHRLRLSSSTAGDYPCFLAAGGHAGLVILLEVQETFDTLIPTFFLPPKRLGRPRTISATGGKTGSNKLLGGKTKATPSTGKKSRTLGGSFAKAKSMHTALSKYTKKLPLKTKGNGKRARKSFLRDDGAEDTEDSVAEKEESEFEERDDDEDDDDEEDESDMSMIMEDSSDDDRMRDSDDEVDEETEAKVMHEDLEEARLMKEYQLDLSEEDALLLALQMSETGETAGLQTGDRLRGKVETSSDKMDSKPTSTGPKRVEKNKVESARATAKANVSAGKAPGKGKKRARPVSTTRTARDDAETTLGAAAASQVPARKGTAKKTKKENPLLIHQTMALQSFEYQLGMSEEDALKEAIRLSAMDVKHCSLGDTHEPSDPAKGALPTPTQPKQTPATPRTKGPFQKRQQKKGKDDAQEKSSIAEKTDAASVENEAQQQRPQTPRRLEFSPLNESEGGGDQVEIPTANIDGLGKELASCQVDAAASTAPALTKLPSLSPSACKSAPTNSATKASSSDKTEVMETKEAASASALKSKQPLKKRSINTGKASKARGSTNKRKELTSRVGRRNKSSGADLSEDDAILLALQLSKIEY